MNRDLQIADAGLRIAEERAIIEGRPGLTVWTDTSRRALARHRQAIHAVASEIEAARADLFAAKQRGRGVLSALERTNRALAGAVERLGLCLLLGALLHAAAFAGDDDDQARRVPRARRRREDVCEIVDGETGEALS